MVIIKDLYKSFGRLNVLRGVNLTIPEGKSVAILGPNGSGKTTLIKCLLGLVIPDQGDIFIDSSPVRNNWKYRNTIGYLPQIARFPENLTVNELFRMIADLRINSKGSSLDPSYQDKLISLFKVQNFLNKPLRSLSGGTRQKVNVILSMMFNPSLYIFDEPTVGLDPISCVRFKESVLMEKKNNKTIILTTHILSEVEEMADEIVFLLEGNVYYHGSTSRLVQEKNAPDLEKAIARMLEEREMSNSNIN